MENRGRGLAFCNCLTVVISSAGHTLLSTWWENIASNLAIIVGISSSSLCVIECSFRLMSPRNTDCIHGMGMEWDVLRAISGGIRHLKGPKWSNGSL